MFSLFKKESTVEKLQKKYKNLLEQSFVLSKTNRMESDKKFAEAQEVLIEINTFNNEKA